MLPNHAPLAVAEQFALLEAAAPGRIDLGIGRAPGSRPGDVDGAARCRRAATIATSRRFPQYLDDVVALMSARGVRVPHCRNQRLRPQGHARRGERADGCGCWARRCTRRIWPPPRGCRTCSPTTSPGRAPRRRSRSTATEFRPSDLAAEPITFMTVNASVAPPARRPRLCCCRTCR